MKSRPPRKQPSTKSPKSAKVNSKVTSNSDFKLAVGSLLTLFGGLGLYFAAPPLMWFAAIVFIAGLVTLYFYLKDQGGL